MFALENRLPLDVHWCAGESSGTLLLRDVYRSSHAQAIERVVLLAHGPVCVSVHMLSGSSACCRYLSNQLRRPLCELFSLVTPRPEVRNLRCRDFACTVFHMYVRTHVCAHVHVCYACKAGCTPCMAQEVDAARSCTGPLQSLACGAWRSRPASRFHARLRGGLAPLPALQRRHHALPRATAPHCCSRCRRCRAVSSVRSVRGQRCARRRLGRTDRAVRQRARCEHGSME